MNTLGISCGILVAMSVLLLIGEIFGRENIIEGDSTLVTYPFRLYFRKKWKTLLYKVIMGGLAVAFSVIFTLCLLSFAGEWVALLIPFVFMAAIILSYYLSIGLLFLLGFFIFLIYGWQEDK